MLVNFQSNRTIGSISIGLFPVRIIKRKKIPTGPRPQTSVATGFSFWVATRGRSRPDFFFGSRPGSRPDFFFGSRPVVGRDRIFFLGRDPCSVATHQKIPVATSTGSRSPTLIFIFSLVFGSEFIWV
jgi:hypothetical protein